jgi:hypothetical protein
LKENVGDVGVDPKRGTKGERTAGSSGCSRPLRMFSTFAPFCRRVRAAVSVLPPKTEKSSEREAILFSMKKCADRYIEISRFRGLANGGKRSKY